jgi:hypothetical protein
MGRTQGFDPFGEETAGFPFYCRDLKQLMDDLNVKKSELPAQSGAEHDAMADAIWARDAYVWIAAHRFGP